MITKICPKCNTEQNVSYFQKSADRKDGLQVYCKNCRKNSYPVDKNKSREASVQYRKTEQYKKWSMVRYMKNKEEILLKCRIRKEKLRTEALQKYGGVCECCGEDNLGFLVIDHINGGGTKHRKTLKGGSAIYLWLKRENYPEGFRVLCHNCNWSTYRNGGTCSHKNAGLV